MEGLSVLIVLSILLFISLVLRNDDKNINHPVIKIPPSTPVEMPQEPNDERQEPVNNKLPKKSLCRRCFWWAGDWCDRGIPAAPKVWNTCPAYLNKKSREAKDMKEERAALNKNAEEIISNVEPTSGGAANEENVTALPAKRFDRSEIFLYHIEKD
jgi:hypothetical protein